jgi:hypothetical protein
MGAVMNRIAIGIAASALLACSALAQTPSTPPAAGPGARTEISPEQRARFRAARDACVTEVKPATLPRGERRKAMRSCLEAKLPESAPIFARGEARRGEMRQLRDTCRGELRGRRVARDERRQAMQTCMVQKKPELAKVFSCRDEAVKRSLSPGPERRTFMRTCLTG